MTDAASSLSKPVRSFLRLGLRWEIRLSAVEVDGEIRLIADGEGRELRPEYQDLFQRHKGEVAPLIWAVQREKEKL